MQVASGRSPPPGARRRSSMNQGFTCGRRRPPDGAEHPSCCPGFPAQDTRLERARPHGVAVSTRAFHARSRGSIPLGGTYWSIGRCGRSERLERPSSGVKAPLRMAEFPPTCPIACKGLRPSAPMVVALLALFVALDGPATAARIVSGATIKRNSITNKQIRNGTIGTLDLSKNAQNYLRTTPAKSVGANQLRDGAVGGKALAGKAVDASKLADGAVGNSQLAARSVDAGKLADGAVGTAQLAAGAVTASKVADGAIGGSAIADGSLQTRDLGDYYRNGHGRLHAVRPEHLPGLGVLPDSRPTPARTTRSPTTSCRCRRARLAGRIRSSSPPTRARATRSGSWRVASASDRRRHDRPAKDHLPVRRLRHAVMLRTAFREQGRSRKLRSFPGPEIASLRLREGGDLPMGGMWMPPSHG